MDGDLTNKSHYKCCFCNTIIQSSYSDPCAIDILINFDKSKKEQYNQVFYCHMNCFKRELSNEMQSYFYLESLVESKMSLDEE